MRVRDVLRLKGDLVVTIEPGATVHQLLAQLNEHRVGALVVSSGAGDIQGIVSERDVVRRLHRDGAAMLDAPVSSIMTTAVHTTTPDEQLRDLMVLMTTKRIRHVPVLVDGRLVGIVSIGDVVKNCIDELELERDQLTAYITG